VEISKLFLLNFLKASSLLPEKSAEANVLSCGSNTLKESVLSIWIVTLSTIHESR
jgi:hypothetical protein